MEIRTVGREILGDLHALLAESLPHDRFSAALLHEKLFDNPRPDSDTYHVFGAFDRNRLAGFMQSVRRGDRAWLGLFAVDPAFRRRGVATALFDRAQETWASATDVEVLALPGNYFAPGLDPRYTAALGFLEKRGFERFKDCVNMTVELTGPFVTRLTSDEFVIRRATGEDAPRLDEFFLRHFGEDWRFEVQRAQRALPVGVHVALSGERVVAFAAHSSQNREWGFFGPMGTAPEAEGRGLGRVLLHRCLADLYSAGHGKAVIPWVGPISFYARHCNARVDRVFWRYRRIAGVRLEGDRVLEDGVTALLTVAGRWTGAPPCPVDRAMKRHVDRGVRRIIVDGARLYAIADAATAMAAEWGGKLRSAGGFLCFVRVPPPVHTAMELAGVLTTALIRESMEDAQRL